MRMKQKAATNQMFRPVSPFEEFTGYSYHQSQEESDTKKEPTNALFRNQTFPPTTKQTKKTNKSKASTTQTDSTPKTTETEPSKRRFSLRCSSRKLRGLRYISTPPKAAAAAAAAPGKHATVHKTVPRTPLDPIPRVIRIPTLASSPYDSDESDEVSEITLSPSQFFRMNDKQRGVTVNPHGFLFPRISSVEHNATWGITTAALDCTRGTWSNDDQHDGAKKDNRTMMIRPTDLLFPHMYWANRDPESMMEDGSWLAATRDDHPTRERGNRRESSRSQSSWNRQDGRLGGDDDKDTWTTGSWLADI